MFTKLLLTLSFGCSALFSFSQKEVDSLLALGDKFYKNKQFEKTAPLWLQAASLAKLKTSKRTYYYAANAFAYAKDSINSFAAMELAIYKWGFNDLAEIVVDDAFDFIKLTPRWKKLVAAIQPAYTTDPRKLKIIDTDVNNFWLAYDKAEADSARAKEIYQKYYFDKGTVALEFYYENKIKTVANFVKIHNRKRNYYKTCRANTLKAGQMKNQYRQSFINLKKIYPQAIYPPIYFVMGKLNSGGTVSPDGLILAMDHACMSSAVDTSELTTWEKKNIKDITELPHTVAHELIHYEQKAMASDTTLLRAAIVEGMADFIGELIAGKNSNERLLIFARGKETKIWEDFKKEMYLNRAYNWIANSDQETADKPADLGYWVGYQICKAYYKEAKNKRQAIYDMLHIKDYKDFLVKSKLEEKLK